MRLVLVCGGRDFHNRAMMFDALDTLHDKTPVDVIVHGGCGGADRLSGVWAESRKVSYWVFPADWSKGPLAGPERNRRILDTSKPNLVVAFPGGKGTRNMVAMAFRDGLWVIHPADSMKPRNRFIRE